MFNFKNQPKTLWRYVVAAVKTDAFFAAAVVIVWQAGLTVIGYVIDTSPLPTSGLFDATPKTLLGHTLRWDSGWYMEIINSNFYQDTSSQGAIFAFYPLYPLLVGLLSNLTFGVLDLPTASFVINTVASFFIALALIRIVKLLTTDTRLSYLTTLVFIASPAAFFLHVFYSEAVFIALGAWAYLFALKRQWGYMCALLAVLTASRLPSVLFLGLCALEYLRAHQWKFGRILKLRSTLWLLTTPIGFLSYSAWCYYVSGDPLAMFHAYKAPDGWPYQVLNLNVAETVLQSTTLSAGEVLAGRTNKPLIVNHILPLLSVTILLVGSLWGIFRKKGVGIPLGIFGVLAATMFTLNSNLISVHRYVLACTPLFILYALFLLQHPRLKWVSYLVILGMLILQLGLYILFITGNFAG
jgi:hypothetical protein